MAPRRPHDSSTGRGRSSAPRKTRSRHRGPRTGRGTSRTRPDRRRARSPCRRSAAVAASSFRCPGRSRAPTMCVSVPLIAITSKKKAMPSPQKSHERSASPTPAPGMLRAAPRDFPPRSGAMSNPGGSRTNRSDRDKGQHDDRGRDADIGHAPADMHDQRRRELRHQRDAEPDPGHADTQRQSPLPVTEPLRDHRGIGDRAADRAGEAGEGEDQIGNCERVGAEAAYRGRCRSHRRPATAALPDARPQRSIIQP